MPVSIIAVREELKELSVEFDKSEDDLKALQSGVGQIVGEVLRQLTEDKCEYWNSIHVHIIMYYNLLNKRPSLCKRPPLILDDYAHPSF